MNVTLSNYTLPTKTVAFGAGVFDNQLILFGGHAVDVGDDKIEYRLPTAAVWDYDPSLSEWQSTLLTYHPFGSDFFRFQGDSIVQIPGSPIVYGCTPNLDNEKSLFLFCCVAFAKCKHWCGCDVQ